MKLKPVVITIAVLLVFALVIASGYFWLAPSSHLPVPRISIEEADGFGDWFDDTYDVSISAIPESSLLRCSFTKEVFPNQHLTITKRIVQIIDTAIRKRIFQA